MAIDPAIDGEALFEDILGLYQAFRRPIRFKPADISTAYEGDDTSYQFLAQQMDIDQEEIARNELNDITEFINLSTLPR